MATSSSATPAGNQFSNEGHWYLELPMSSAINCVTLQGRCTYRGQYQSDGPNERHVENIIQHSDACLAVALTSRIRLQQIRDDASQLLIAAIAAVTANVSVPAVSDAVKEAALHAQAAAANHVQFLCQPGVGIRQMYFRAVDDKEDNRYARFGPWDGVVRAELQVTCPILSEDIRKDIQRKEDMKASFKAELVVKGTEGRVIKILPYE